MIDARLETCIEHRWPEYTDSPLYGWLGNIKSIWQTSFSVPCSGSTHRLKIDRGTLVLRDHPGDLTHERTLARIAGNAACFQVLDASGGRASGGRGAARSDRPPRCAPRQLAWTAPHGG